MATERLTKGLIDGLRPAKPRPVRASKHGDAKPDKLTTPDRYVWDGGKGSVSGFGVKVTPAGSKTFVFQYRMRGAKSDRRYKIGKFGDWTVDVARDRARELRRMVDAGTDPLQFDKDQAQAAAKAKRDAVDRSFSAVADRWLDMYRNERFAEGPRKGRTRSASTIQMVETAMAHFKNEFGASRIDEIDDDHLSAAVGSIPADRIATRRNAFASARVLWAWAQRQRLVADNPFDRLKAPAPPQDRDRTLDEVELALFWRATRKIPYPFGPSYRLLALTGQRRDEVTGMWWQELNRDAREWCIPASRTKNGKPHIVPLSEAAIAELDAIAPKDNWPAKGLVFTVTGKTPISGHSGAKRRLDAQIAELAEKEGREPPERWRVHDLRRTVATGLQQLSVRFEVTEAVLNHMSGYRGGIAGIYQRHDWKAEKREALEIWSEHVLSLVRPKPVSSDEVETG